MIRYLRLLILGTIIFISVHSQSTREDIIASRVKRCNQLQGVLDQTEKKIQDHRSGSKKLELHRLEHMEHKMRAYQHQLEELGRELDEDEIDRMIDKAEEIRKERMYREL